MAEQYIAAKQREAEALRDEIRVKTSKQSRSGSAKQSLPAIPRSAKSGRSKHSKKHSLAPSQPTHLPLVVAPLEAGLRSPVAARLRSPVAAGLSPLAGNGEAAAASQDRTHSDGITLGVGAPAQQQEQQNAGPPAVASPSKHKLSAPRMARLRVKIKLAAKLMRLQAIEVPPLSENT